MTQTGQLTITQGRCAEDQALVSQQIIDAGLVDVNGSRDVIAAEGFLDEFCNLAGLAGIITEENANFWPWCISCRDNAGSV